MSELYCIHIRITRRGGLRRRFPHTGARDVRRRPNDRATMRATRARLHVCRSTPRGTRRDARDDDDARRRDDATTRVTSRPVTTRRWTDDDDARARARRTQAVPQGAGGAVSNADEYAKIRATHANVTVRARTRRRAKDDAGDARRGKGRGKGETDDM